MCTTAATFPENQPLSTSAHQGSIHITCTQSPLVRASHMAQPSAMGEALCQDVDSET